MRSIPILVLLAGLVVAGSAWKLRTEYVYEVRSRTLSGIHEVANQFAGLLMKSTIKVAPLKKDYFSVQVLSAEFARIHTTLTNGVQTPISDNDVQYSPITLSSSVFEVSFHRGVILAIIVNNDSTNWEVNFFKSIATQLQVDTTGVNAVQSEAYKFPTEDDLQGSYITDEDSVTGRCKTVYTVSPVPLYLAKTISHLVPMPDLNVHGSIIDVTKFKNFSDCQSERDYASLGVTGQNHWHSTKGQLGNFLSRSQFDRVLISGSLEEYTIQSYQTTNQIVVSPHLYNNQKGIVFSSINLTLFDVDVLKNRPESLANKRIISDLSLEYDISDSGTTPQTNQINQSKQPKQNDWGYEMESSKEHEENSLSSKSSSPAKVAEDLIEEIYRREVVNSDIVSSNMLSRFSLLTRVIRMLNEEQLKNLTRQFFERSESPNGKSHTYWRIYRDAVAQAGTYPALVTISGWVRNGLIRMEEAAQVFAVLPNSVRYPTAKYVDQFYRIIQMTEVKSDCCLNSTALLAFSDLTRRAIIEKELSVKSYLPYVEYLGDELKSAVEEGWSPKTQTYIRALGNIAQPEVVKIFKDVMEGEIPVSDYLRMFIIYSFDYLTKTSPKVAQRVLYSVYANIGETPAIRSVAAMLIMKTNPPAELLQRMAQFTNEDPSDQVSSLVHSAITTAAQLETPQSAELSRNARSAKSFLSPKKYRPVASSHSIQAYLVKGLSLGYKHDVTFIQGEDSTMPKAAFYYLRRMMGEYKLPYKQTSFLTSSPSQMLYLLASQFDQSTSRGSSQNSKTSTSDKIAEALGLSAEGKDYEFEGGAMFGYLGGYRFFGFNRNSIQAIPSYLRKIYSQVEKEADFDYTKYYNQFSLNLALPTATGLTFNYNIDIPTKFSLKGTATGSVYPDWESDGATKFPSYMSTNVTAQVLYSLRTQSTMGFYVPFTDEYFLAGFDKNTHLHLPMDFRKVLDLGKKTFQLSVQRLKERDEDLKMLETSANLYTTVSKVHQFVPYQESENRVDIRQGDNQSAKNQVIQIVPYTFAKRWETVEPLSTVSSLLKQDFMSAWLYPYADKELQNYNITVVDDQPRDQKLLFAFNVQNVVVEPDEDVKPLNGKYSLRRNDVKNYNSYRWDFLSDFHELNTSVYYETVESPLEPEARIVGSFKTNENREGNFSLTHTGVWFPMNFKQAIVKEPRVEGKATFSDHGQVEVTVNYDFRRTEDRAKYLLRKNLDGVKCSKDMQKGEFLTPPCVRSTVEATLMNFMNLNAEVLYNNDSDVATTPMQYAIEIDPLFESGTGFVRQDDKLKTIRPLSKENVNAIKSVMIDNVVPQSSPFSSKCYMDANSVTTFDGTTYPIQNIGACSHVIFQSLLQKTNPDSPSSNMTILIKNRKQSQRDVTVLFGDSLVVNIGPSISDVRKSSIYINGEDVTHTDTTNGVYDEEENNQFYFKVSKNEVRLMSKKYSVYLMYDGLRLQIDAGGMYVGRTYGLCGTYTTEPSTDFMTPQNCIVQRPIDFISSYVLPDGSCDERRKEGSGSDDDQEKCYARTFNPSIIPDTSRTNRAY